MLALLESQVYWAICLLFEAVIVILSFCPRLVGCVLQAKFSPLPSGPIDPRSSSQRSMKRSVWAMRRSVWPNIGSRWSSKIGCCKTLRWYEDHYKSRDCAETAHVRASYQPVVAPWPGTRNIFCFLSVCEPTRAGTANVGIPKTWKRPKWTSSFFGRFALQSIFLSHRCFWTPSWWPYYAFIHLTAWHQAKKQLLRKFYQAILICARYLLGVRIL